MAKETKKKVVTRKETTRLRREKRQRNYIIGGTIGVLVLIVGVVVYGLLNELVFQGMKTVATVNKTKISLSEFQTQVRYQRYQYIRTYTSYAQIYNALGPDVGSSFLGNLQSIESTLSEENKATFGKNILQNMVENVAIAQYAEENGITVSQDEIDNALQEAFGYYSNGTPTPTSTVTPFVTSTMSAEQYAIVSPTPTRTIAPPTETVIPTTALLEQTSTPTAEATIESAAPTEGMQATNTATSEPIPTETPYTFEGYESSLDNLLADMESIDFSRADLEELFRYSLLREKVFNILTADVQSVQEQVWARHILVADEETAKEVLQKLDEGNDWAALAEEYSTDESNKYTGGDLGWFYRGKMVDAFDEAAFNLAIGEVSQPIQTDYGWHIIQVIGHETRPLTASDLKSNKELIFNTWLDELTTQDGVKILDNWVDDVPVTPVIPNEVLVVTGS
ncbi:MAG: peptidylprolyl isomerase [Chloroflexi bacterium]|nr:peptidylprolyl isomerase [Chloroflexota bacterium]